MSGGGGSPERGLSHGAVTLSRSVAGRWVAAHAFGPNPFGGGRSTKEPFVPMGPDVSDVARPAAPGEAADRRTPGVAAAPTVARGAAFLRGAR